MSGYRGWVVDLLNLGPHAGTPAARGISRRTLLGALAAAGSLVGCAGPPASTSAPVGTAPGAPAAGTPAPPVSPTPPTAATPTPTPATAAAMAARATVPVLCYHQVRAWQKSDSAYNRSILITPPTRFAAQLDALAQAGFTTISPAQYLAHMTTGAALPSRPVLLTFDDGKDNQATAALPALARRGMTGTLFIMSVVLDKPGWISSDQVRELADLGMTIGAHTWDHQPLPKLRRKADWVRQLEEPRETLRRLSKQEVDALAYPYGSWAPGVLPHVEAAGYASAYQLTDRPLDRTRPQFTLRRTLAASGWTGAQLVERLTALAEAPAVTR